jgi:glycosyltransferase involved in cell wall biosynthesis
MHMSATQPAVSIYIITRLNTAERCGVLKRVCEGALAQRYPDFEVVVSDNAGAYVAEEALDSIRDPRLKVYRNPVNMGFVGNVSLCLERCRNDVIKLLCDDDLIHPDFLTHTVPLVDDETLVVAGVEKYVLGNDPDAYAQPVPETPESEMRKPGYGRDLWSLPYSSCCIPSATLFTRRLFECLGGFDEKTSTPDWDFFIEACSLRQVAHVKHTLCYVGVWPGSFTEEKMDDPFFFPSQSLYTKFRFFHCKALSGTDRATLLFRLFGELSLQSLRPLKHLGSKTYHVSYRDYVRRFFFFLGAGRGAFGIRPASSSQH